MDIEAEIQRSVRKIEAVKATERKIAEALAKADADERKPKPKTDQP